MPLEFLERPAAQSTTTSSSSPVDGLLALPQPVLIAGILGHVPRGVREQLPDAGLTGKAPEAL
jgi:hypothetical protein